MSVCVSHLINDSSPVPTSELWERRQSGVDLSRRLTCEYVSVLDCWISLLNVYCWTKERRGCTVTSSSQRDAHSNWCLLADADRLAAQQWRGQRAAFQSMCNSRLFHCKHSAMTFCTLACRCLCANSSRSRSSTCAGSFRSENNALAFI